MGALKLVEIDDEQERLLEAIKEIKLQKQITMNNPNMGNVVSLLAWYENLLHHVEKKLKA